MIFASPKNFSARFLSLDLVDINENKHNYFCFTQDSDAESVEVKCMARIGHNRYFWPRLEDIIWYNWINILMPIPELKPVTGRHWQIDAEKFKEIQSMLDEVL